MQEVREFCRRLYDIVLSSQITSYDDIRGQLGLLQANVADYLRSVPSSEMEKVLAARQVYVVTKWMVNNPAFVVDFYFRILFLVISDLLKRKAAGKEIPLPVLEEAVQVAEQAKDVILWSPYVFRHTRGGILQIIQGVNQVLRQVDTDKEERRLFNRIKRLLEPILRMGAGEIPLQISLVDLLFAHLPVRLSRDEVVRFLELVRRLSELVDASATFYRHVLGRPVFREIERPVIDNLDVWQHYWSLLISYANDQVTRWGWPDLPSIDVVIYTGTLIENIADSYAYTVKVRGAPPKFVINQPIAKRGSSPADLHLVVHEVTPGHAFHLTFLESALAKAEESAVKTLEEVEKEFVFLPISLVASFYEGWAAFAQWLFGLRAGTPRYNYQWLLEIQFYVDRLWYLAGEKQPDSIHFARLADPLQLSAYFFGYLMWRRFYREVRDDDELLRYAFYGRFPPIDPQGGLRSLNSELSQILDEIENIEKRGKISLEG
jgi:hypothetical protein